MKRKVVLVLCLLMTFSMVFANGKGDKGTATEEKQVAAAEDASSGTLPRNQTLYFAGLQWGPINGWNVLSDDMNNGLAINRNAYGSKTPMFETLYMYNFLDGSMVPLLADGEPKWNANQSEVTVKINSAAKWNDGTPVTAEDVAYSYEISKTIGNANGNSNKPYVDTVVAKDSKTVVVKAVLGSDGNPLNPLMVKQFLAMEYVTQKAWVKKVEDRNGGDPVKIKNDPAEDAAFTGPYGPYFADDQKVVMVRNDNYWGKDSSMWGGLPAPKYLVHTIYQDNPAGETAFKAGEVDVCQQFIPNVQNLWLKDGLPISTYMDQAPYGITGSLPTAYFNLDVPGLDNVNVRKAIAMAVDYDSIIANAMTNQSPTFAQTPRSLMNPTPGEQSLYNKAEVASLQWNGNDVAGANALLDKAGIKDTNGDGIRELNGENLSFNACCPNGWTDWMAAMELVAAAGDKIGIEITTLYPEWSVYQTVVTAAKQDQYEIFMMWTDGSSPTMPWSRVRQLMSSEYNGVEGNWSGNWGHYANKRADEIIKTIPVTTDEKKLKALYTEANKIYLTDVPSFALMYRPNCFHAVNESVWTGFPEDGDGKNIPPADLIFGYGIAGLFNLELVK
jgi:peptide/nickel transport system substrate-binding protein